MIVVSDTTAITTALKADQTGLLTLLSGTVFVPQAVWDELADRHSPLPGFIQLHQVKAPFRRPAGTESLGLGESEAIQLALELGAGVLLTDDRKARNAAAVHGIRCIWLLGLALEAKRRGRISAVRPVLEALEQTGGLYLSERVKAEVLRQAGEADR